jgi:hypothetical protein
VHQPRATTSRTNATAAQAIDDRSAHRPPALRGSEAFILTSRTYPTTDRDSRINRREHPIT